MICCQSTVGLTGFQMNCLLLELMFSLNEMCLFNVVIIPVIFPNT